jgi:hypothetical protein
MLARSPSDFLDVGLEGVHVAETLQKLRRPEHARKTSSSTRDSDT